MKYSLICVNSSLGVNVMGTEMGPRVIRERLDLEGFAKIYDVNSMGSKNDIAGINGVNGDLYRDVGESFRNGNFPIILGGDHSLGIGSGLAALDFYGDVGIIWIDAHADFNTFESSETGNIHGMPLATLCGYGNGVLRNGISDNFIKRENVVMVGTRSIDEKELVNIRDAGIMVISDEEIKEIGIVKAMFKAFDYLKCKFIHISFDMDVIDPDIAMGVSIPEDRGIDLESARRVMDIIQAKKEVVSLDIVEFNPLLDIDNRTRDICVELIGIFMNGTLKRHP